MRNPLIFISLLIISATVLFSSCKKVEEECPFSYQSTYTTVLFYGSPNFKSHMNLITGESYSLNDWFNDANLGNTLDLFASQNGNSATLSGDIENQTLLVNTTLSGNLNTTCLLISELFDGVVPVAEVNLTDADEGSIYAFKTDDNHEGRYGLFKIIKVDSNAKFVTIEVLVEE